MSPFNIFCFDWEDISNPQDSVSSHFQTHLSKILRYASYFQLSLLGVWKCDETLYFVFDILLETYIT